MSHLNLRQKLMAIVCTVVLAFTIATILGWYFDSEVQMQLKNVRHHYIPIIELGYRLDSEFSAIALGLRDAAAAQDPAALEAVSQTKDKLIADLDQSRDFVDPQLIADAKAAVDDYFKIAQETSGRIISSEAGTPLVDTMMQMQAKRIAAQALLKKITAFDRERLTKAFAESVAAQKYSTNISLVINLLCLLFVGLVAGVIWRDLVAKIGAIGAGLERFGAGDFKVPIPVRGRDELSVLGRKVNLMAERLQGLMKEIESFSYSVAHDLRAPLRSVAGFSTVLIEDHGPSLNEDARSSLNRIVAAAQRMGQMVDGLLSLSRLNRTALVKQSVNLSHVAARIAEELKTNDPDRQVKVEVAPEIIASADPKLMEVVLSNLLGNAWKFTKKNGNAQIQFGRKQIEGHPTIFIRDNGAGFDMRYADKLFGTFQRLHTVNEFEGHGIGLATVRSIIGRHGGKIWAESEPEKGATFYFTLD